MEHRRTSFPGGMKGKLSALLRKSEGDGGSFANGQSFEMVNDSQGPSGRAAAVPDDEVNARNCTESESCGRSASN